ncbi:MAG: arginase [Alphaproteobacteria bacterium]|nr:arginase [Alphaproteobacteria bacterium]
MRPRVAVIFVGNGWGAPDMRAANGAKKAAKVLPELLSQENPDIFYMDFHKTDSLRVDTRIPKDALSSHFSQVTQVSESLSALIMDLIQKELFPIVIGGDHSIAIGTWSGVRLAEPERDFGLLWFDAHMDAHTPMTSESQSPHGMPLATLMGKGFADWVNLGQITPKLYPENLALLGIRSYEKGEAHFLKENQVKVFFQKDIEKIGLDTAYQAAYKHVTKSTPYFGVSIDVDAFDPSIAPGTGTVEENGLMDKDLLPLLTGLRSNPNCLAFEIAEFNPDKDQDNKTLNLIISLINEVLKEV